MMRARGASVTDIIVLVVAADDGVMAQTREVVSLAQTCNVPILVAINKIDKAIINIDRTKRELTNLGLILEENGGDTQVVLVSATKSLNLNLLADAINLQAQLAGLKADVKGMVEATIVESRTDAKRGKLSTAIIQRGTLRKGCILVSGEAWARVRGLFNDVGVPMTEATPGYPVEVLGWRELPSAGSLVLEVESEKRAAEVLRFRAVQSQQQLIKDSVQVVEAKAKAHYDQYKAERDARRSAGRFKSRRIGPRLKETSSVDLSPCVNVIVKGDVHGSVEAILDVLETYNLDDQCRLNVVHYGVGGVSDSDVDLAQTFGAIIYAFNVESLVKATAGVAVRNFRVIYQMVDDLKAEISKKLPPKLVEEIIGEANVMKLFTITEGKTLANVLGCRCTKGILRKNEVYRLVRNGEIVCEGKLCSMKHLKNEVDSVKKDVECGLRFDNNTVAEPGDTVICFKVNEESQITAWDSGF